MQPIVSVVMPVYNQEKFVAETIESILAQSFTDFEILIVDDGSNDNSAEIIRQYAARDQRITAFYKPNKGKCEATNYLMDKAQGKWCALLDADDVMMPDRIQKQLQFHQSNPTIHASSCHCYYIDEKGRTLHQQRYPFLQSLKDCEEVRKSGKLIQVAYTGIMILRSLFSKLGGLDSAFWPTEDFEFVNRFIENGYNMVIIQEPLMKYRIHTSAITVKSPLQVADKLGYCIHSINARRSMQPTISFDEFMVMRNQESWWVRFNRKRYIYSQVYSRKAGFELCSRQYGSFLMSSATAALLSPKYFIGKVLNLRKKK